MKRAMLRTGDVEQQSKKWSGYLCSGVVVEMGRGGSRPHKSNGAEFLHFVVGAVDGSRCEDNVLQELSAAWPFAAALQLQYGGF